MLDKSLLEQIKGRWREFRREPSAFFGSFFMPIVWMLVLGFTFTDEKPEIYGVGWVESPSAEVFKVALESESSIDLISGSEEDLKVLLKRGDISLYVYAKDSGAFSFVYDTRNPLGQRARVRVNDSLQIAAGRTEVIPVEDQRVDAQGLRYVDFLVPGLLGLSIMTSSLFGIGMTIVSNRKENLLKRYIATPMPASSYVVSHIVGRGLILTVE